MHDHPAAATNANGFLPGPLGLRLDEAFLPLMALNGSPRNLDTLVAFGHYTEIKTSLCLRFSPDTVLISGDIPVGNWRMIDLSHGLTHLRLRGIEALHFLGHYTSANLHSAQLRDARAVRCRLNHYECAIWWATTRDVHILIERSLAQSFCDHLGALAQRHSGVDHLHSQRPVIPEAPDRRG
ncbi:MAG: hypothetical protein P8Q92_18095 [Pseudoprimorskyibacter sp.]|jgi:hypothetical protein|nr:hypothetical protein [Pseudoprimorskyibacter sp.]